MKTESQTTFYPVAHECGITDKRYTVRTEFIGKDQPVCALRFCGDYLGGFISLDAATQAAHAHKFPADTMAQ